MILTASWAAYDGPGRLALFGPAPRGTRRGYRVLDTLHPGARSTTAATEAAFRSAYGAQLLALDGRNVLRCLVEAVYPAAPVLMVAEGDPLEATARDLAARWITLQTGHTVIPVPAGYRPQRADPRLWRFHSTVIGKQRVDTESV